MQSAAQTASALPVSTVAVDRALVPAWAKVLVVALAFCWLYSDNLQRLWIKTNFFTGDRSWSHSMMIPLIGIYYLLLHRDELRATPIQPLLGDRFTRARFVSVAIAAIGGLITWLGAPHVVPAMDSTIQPGAIVSNLGLGLLVWSGLALLLDWGLGTLAAGLLLSAYGIWPGQNDFVWDVGMVVTLFGIVLTMCGWQVMRIAWFPLAFLLCALPWPPLVYSAIALPLQKIAAVGSVLIMNLLGVEASHGGSKIFIAQFDPVTGVQLEDRPLNVAEACAGLVSLMTFISIAAAVAFLSSRAIWQKLIITGTAVPIAILCNVIRVAGVGMLDKYGGREWSDGFAHAFAGMVLLLPGFFMIMFVCWIVDQLVVEEADDAIPAQKAGASAVSTSNPAGGAA